MAPDKENMFKFNNKILIADDSKFMRSLIKNCISEMDFNKVIEARDGIEAVRLYEKYKPDITIMDIVMDKIDGLNALKKIMKLNKNANIIMCSSVGQKWLINECIECGAKDFIIKPFNAAQITKILTKALKVDYRYEYLRTVR